MTLCYTKQALKTMADATLGNTMLGRSKCWRNFIMLTPEENKNLSNLPCTQKVIRFTRSTNLYFDRAYYLFNWTFKRTQDHHSVVVFLKMVGQRRGLWIRYLKISERYRSIISKLNIRKMVMINIEKCRRFCDIFYVFLYLFDADLSCGVIYNQWLIKVLA